MQQPVEDTLISLFHMDSEKGGLISRAFTSLYFEFNQYIGLPENKKEKLYIPILSTVKKLGRLAEATDRSLKLEDEKMSQLEKQSRESKNNIVITYEDSSTELEAAVVDIYLVLKNKENGLKRQYGVSIPTNGIIKEEL